VEVGKRLPNATLIAGSNRLAIVTIRGTFLGLLRLRCRRSIRTVDGFASPLISARHTASSEDVVLFMG
jgi:hypothetical protein